MMIICRLTTALFTGLERLFNYIGGANLQHKRLPLTSPVLTYIYEGRTKTNFTVSFYAAYNAQRPHRRSPKPTHWLVHLRVIKCMIVAVISFDGPVDEEEVFGKAKELKELLAKTGLNYERKSWYYAAYDPPYVSTDRYQEIWIQIYHNIDDFVRMTR